MTATTAASLTPVQKRSNLRIAGLDGLRGIAAASVLVYHYLLRYGELYHHPATAPQWLNIGREGVPLFFMISGFVILMTLDRAHSLADFAVARFARLFPAYWTAILLTFTAVFLLGLPDGSHGIPLRDALLNFTMVHKFIAAAQDVDGVYWTLERELFFYLLMAGLFLLGLRKRILWPFAILVALNIVRCLLPGLEARIPGHRTIVWAFNLEFNHFFLLGICLYTARSGWRLLHGLLTPLCLAAALFDDARFGTVNVVPFLHPLIIAGLFGLVAAATTWDLPLLTAKPLVFLGVISYSLYLIHQNLGYIVIGRAYHLGLPEYAAVLAAAVVVLALATALCFGVEKPANAFLRRKLSGFLPRPATAA